MAEYIQSEVKVIHSVEAGSPTESGSPTEATVDVEDGGETPGDKATNLSERFQGIVRGSVLRKGASILETTIVGAIDRGNLSNFHREALIGNSRGMSRIRNTMAITYAWKNTAMGTLGAAITGYAVKSKVVPILFFVNEALRMQQNYMNYQQQLQFQRDFDNIEMFISSKRQDRLIIGTHRR